MKFPFMQKRKPRAGFTLIELLVVMGVILILAGIVVGVQRGVYQQQSQARANADMQIIANALETFKQKYGDYPWIQDDEDQLFDVLTGRRVLRPDSSGNYGMRAPSDSDRFIALIDESLIETDDEQNPDYFTDPWGKPYVYYYKTSKDDGWNHTGFILLSSGPDGEEGDASDFNDGNFPQKADDYYGDPDEDTFDNIVYGLERQ